MCRSLIIIAFVLLSGSPLAKSPSINLIEKKIENENYREAIQIADSIIADLKPGNISRALQLKADALFYLNELDSSLFFYLQSAKTSKTIPFEKKNQLIECFGHIGFCYLHTGQYELAINYYDTALIYSTELKDSVEMATALSSIGKARMALGQYDLATEYFLKAYKLDSIREDSIGLAYDISNLGLVNSKLGYHEKAIEYLENALKVESSIGNNPLMYTSRLQNLAKAYLLGKNYKEAALTISDAIIRLEKLGNMTELNKAALVKAEIQLLNGNPDTAIFLADNSHKYFIDNNLYELEIKSGILLARGYLQKKNLKSARNTLEYVLESAEVNTLYSNYLEEINLLLAQLSEIQNKPLEALKYYKNYLKYYRNNFNSKQLLALEELDKKYLTSQRIQQIQILEQENDLKEAEVKNRKRNQFILFLILLSTTLALVVILILYMNRKKNLELMASKNEVLTQLDNTKNKLFSIISHDLKSPVSSFHTITKSLTENWENLEKNQLKSFIESLRDSSEYLRDMMDNLLKWALAQTDQLSYETESIDPVSVIEKVETQLKTVTELKRIRLKKEINSQEKMIGDWQFVEIVIRNILSNALKFSKISSEVSIAVDHTKNKQIITISDKGVGMSQSAIENLLKGEILAQDIKNSSEKGTGLGLALCKELMDKMGAEMEVNSQKNKGTSFKLIFDRAS